MNRRKTDEMTSLQDLLVNYLLERAVKCAKQFKDWIMMIRQAQINLPAEPDPANVRTITVRWNGKGEYIVEDLSLVLPYVGNDPSAYVGRLLEAGFTLWRVCSDTLEDDEDAEILVLKFVDSED